MPGCHARHLTPAEYAEWARRYASAPILKVGGAMSRPMRNAFADTYLTPYKRAVKRVMDAAVRQAVANVRASRAPVSAAMRKALAKALYRAQRPLLLAMVQRGYDLAGKELPASRRKAAEGLAGLAGCTIMVKKDKPAVGVGGKPTNLILRIDVPSVEDWLRKVASSQTAALAARIARLHDTYASAWDEETQQGLTVAQLADALLEDGLAMSEARAEMIARTNTIWALNEGAVERYDDAGIKAVRWLATEDDLTCDYCLDLDGEAVEVGDAFAESNGWDVAHPPLHPNCRCTVVPVV